MSSVIPTSPTALSPQPLTRNAHLLAWVNEMAKLAKPDRIFWCDGSEDERRRLTEESVGNGTLIPLNQEKLPGCYLHRSNPNDVARIEHLTFICTPTRGRRRPDQQLDGARRKRYAEPARSSTAR